MNVAQSTGVNGAGGSWGDEKTNFYDADKNILATYPSPDNRAVVIPAQRQKNANNAIKEYGEGKLSSMQLYNILNLHGTDYQISYISDGRASISMPKDIWYYYHLTLYSYTKHMSNNRGSEFSAPYPDLDQIGWNEYNPIIVGW